MSATATSFAYVRSPALGSSLCWGFTNSHLWHHDIDGVRASANCCSHDCVHFNCYSLIASASATAPRSRLPQLLLPDCIHFRCCSLIDHVHSISGCAHFSYCSPQLCPHASPDILEVPNILEHSSLSSRFRSRSEVQRSHIITPTLTN